MSGNVVHVELPAGDTTRARGFWGGLFGWKWESMEGPFEYSMAQIDDKSGAAVFPADGNDRGVRTYFDVDDINVGVARVKELGGEAGEAQPVPGFGWFSMCKDTEGNQFGLWQSDTSAPAPAQ